MKEKYRQHFNNHTTGYETEQLAGIAFNLTVRALRVCSQVLLTANTARVEGALDVSLDKVQQKPGYNKTNFV